MDVVDTGAEIRFHDFETGQVRNVDWEVGDIWEREELEVPARNIARVYEAFAEKLGGAEGDGDEEGEGKLADFDEALKRHRMVDAMEKSSEERRVGR